MTTDVVNGFVIDRGAQFLPGSRSCRPGDSGDRGAAALRRQRRVLSSAHGDALQRRYQYRRNDRPCFRLPANLASVYGLLIPRLERQHIAAIGIETNKNRACTAQGQLLNIMLSNPASHSLMALPDEAIVQRVMPEAEKFFPGLAEHVEATQIYRWPQAEPYSRVGRATDLRQYRDSCCSSLPRVLLAGDYMSMPFTEGAAQSGKWAAEQICMAVSNLALQQMSAQKTVRPD